MTTTLAAPPRRLVDHAVVRVKAVGSDSLYRNSFMLLMNTAVQTALGSLFWVVAARRYTDSSVGLLTTTLSALVLISTASCLGFPNALVRYLPRRPSRSGELAVTTAALAAMVATVLFAVTSLTPWAVPLVRGQSSAWLLAVGLSTLVLSVAGMLFDSIFVAQRSAHLLLVKNTLAGLLKVGGVVLLPATGVGTLALANLFGLVGGVALTLFLLLPRVSRPLRLRTSALAGAWTFSVGNHIGMVFGILPATLTPLIVLGALDARHAAYFGMTMILLGLLNVVPQMLSQSLFAELSADPAHGRVHVGKALRAIYLLITPCVVVLVVAAPTILGVFGPAYAAGGATCLRWMAIASLLASLSYVIDVWVNSLGRAGGYVFLNVSNAALVLLAVVLAAPHGLSAVGLAWLVAQSASVLVALVALLVVQRSDRQGGPPTVPHETPAQPETPVQFETPVQPEPLVAPEPLALMEKAGVATAPGTRRLPLLDGLRGLAATFVVASHCWSTVYLDAHADRSLTQLLTSWMGLGHYAVSVFIVISGFSLGLVAWRGGLGWPGGTRAFLRGRFRRIVPAYWAAIALGAGLGATVLAHPVGTLWDGAVPIRPSGVVVHALLLQDVMWAGPAGSTAFWSLAVEWHIYLLFPLLLLLLRRRPDLWLIPVLFAGVVACLGVLAPTGTLLARIGGTHPSLYALFVLGLVSARYISEVTDRSSRRRHERQLLVAAAAGSVLAAIASVHGVDPVSPVHDLWFGPLAALVIVRMAVAAPRRVSLRAALEHRMLVRLGMISYSLYLVHAAAIEMVWRWGVRPWHLPEPLPLVLEVGLGVVFSVTWAMLFYRLVERRFASPRATRAARSVGLLAGRRPATAPETVAAPEAAAVPATP